MNAVNWLLINGADALRWLWHVIATFFTVVFAALDTVLNPVLSPLLTFLNPICTMIGDGVYAVLSPLPVWLGLTLLAAVTGVVMLIAFRYTSNQAAIGRARDAITANLLALKLYKDELRVALRAQRRLLGALLRLQAHMLVPVLIMLLPVVLLLAQMGLRYQWQPLRSGERTLIKVHVDPNDAQLQDGQLEPGPGAIVEAGPVPGGGVLVWRVRAGEPGRHTLRFNLGGAVVEKQITVSDRFERVSARRPARRWTSQILHPVEPPLPADSPARSVEILYGSVDSWIRGTNWWVFYFFVVSMAGALLLKPLLKVRF